MRREDGRRVGALLGLVMAAACTPAVAQDVGGFFKDMFGGSSPPAAGSSQAADETFCPQVDVAEGGAAVSAFGSGKVGQPNAMRSQITLSNFARECRPQADGSVVVKVGVQGRALLGPSGSAGTFSSPVHFTLHIGDRVIANRVQRVNVKIPPGETQGAFTLVQDGLVVPRADASEFEIEVGLGSGRPGKKAPARSMKAQPGQS